MSTKVGIVGCGNISEIYLKNSWRLADIEVVAVSDLDRQRAQARADGLRIPNVLSIPELLAEGEVDIVVNLTIPKAHSEVALATLEAGKSAYNEKTLRNPARGRTRNAGTGARKRTQDRLRARYVFGCRPANVPATHGFRGDRRSGWRNSVHDVPRS